MRFLLYISRFMIPLVIVYMITFGLLMKRPVYDDFAEGAKEGARTVVGVFPTLVGLMVGTGILRASALLSLLCPTESHCHKRCHQGDHKSRAYDRHWHAAAILAAVGDHIHRDQLKRRNVDDQKGTHFPAGRALWNTSGVHGICPAAFFFQLF